MPGGSTTLPALVEKQVVDIDLVDSQLVETVNEEAVDWTKDLTDLQNLVPTPGQFIQRKGAPTLAQVDDSAATIAPCYRLAAFNTGVGLVGNSYNLYHLNETGGNLVNKGKMPEFSVTKQAAGATADVTAVTGVCGTAILSNFNVIAYQGEFSSTVSQLTIDVVDPESNNVIRTWTITSSALTVYTVVGVGGRYIHIYRHLPGSASVKPGMSVVDTASLPASGAINPTFTDFTSSAAGDQLVGVVPLADGSGSVGAITSSSSNNWIQKYNNLGAFVLNASVAGFTTLSGLDTDGTNFYVSGRALNVPNQASIANMTLTTYLTAYPSGTWTGTASGGTSGTNNYTANTSSPAFTTLNSLGVASFSAVQSLISASATTVNIAGSMWTWFVGNVTSAGGIMINALAGVFQISSVTGGIKVSVNGASVTIPMPTGVWFAMAITWDGSGNAKVFVNRRDPTALHYTSTSGSSALTLNNGTTGGAVWLLAELITATGAGTMTRGVFDDLRDIANSRYALSL